MKLLLVNSNVDKSRKERTHEYAYDVCADRRGQVERIGNVKKEIRVALAICICVLVTAFMRKALIFIGSNMGPPSNKRSAQRYLQEHMQKFEKSVADKFLNLDVLSEQEVLQFMATDSDSVWYFIGENKSVSDDTIIKGYDAMPSDNKVKFRENWRYWGWTSDRPRLGNHVWKEATK